MATKEAATLKIMIEKIEMIKQITSKTNME